jgi:hypothetical protein
MRAMRHEAATPYEVNHHAGTATVAAYWCRPTTHPYGTDTRPRASNPALDDIEREAIRDEGYDPAVVAALDRVRAELAAVGVAFATAESQCSTTLCTYGRREHCRMGPGRCRWC